MTECVLVCALQAARDTVTAHFAPRYMDQIRNLLVDARRFLLRWGGEDLEQWSAKVDTSGYAGAAEQMAVRTANETVGGAEAQEFWLLGPAEAFEIRPLHVAIPLTSVDRKVVSAHAANTQEAFQQQGHRGTAGKGYQGDLRPVLPGQR